MKKAHGLIVALLMFSPAAFAVDASTVVGGALGGAAGAVIGHNIGGRDGAIVGAAIGGATGAAIGSDNGGSAQPVAMTQRREGDGEYEHRHHDRGHHYGERQHRGEGED